MGQFALIAVALAGTGLAAAQQYRSGKLQEYQFKAEAAQEGDAARQREIDRKRNLLRALASQRASAAAGGADFSGSLGNLARVDIEQAATDLEYDKVNTGRRTRVLRASGKEAAKAGELAAGASLLDGASRTYRAQG